jgi:hypothetical protein
MLRASEVPDMPPSPPQRPTLDISLAGAKLARFSFEAEHVKITGTVSVDLGDNYPDPRTPEQKLLMAKQRVRAFTMELASAAQRMS